MVTQSVKFARIAFSLPCFARESSPCLVLQTCCLVWNWKLNPELQLSKWNTLLYCQHTASPVSVWQDLWLNSSDVFKSILQVCQALVLLFCLRFLFSEENHLAALCHKVSHEICWTRLENPARYLAEICFSFWGLGDTFLSITWGR